MAAGEVPAGLEIPQPHALGEEKLLLPAFREERFSRVTQLALQAGNVLPPHIVAAVVLTDKDYSEDAMARQAAELGEAEEYIMSYPDEFFISANNAGMTAGVIAESRGLTVFNGLSPVDESTGLLIQSQGTVEVGFSGNKIHSVEAAVPTNQPVRISTPGRIVLPLTEENTSARAVLKDEAAELSPINVEDCDDLADMVNDGVLAVGTEAVKAFVEAVSRLPHRHESGHLKRAIRIAMPILELAP